MFRTRVRHLCFHLSRRHSGGAPSAFLCWSCHPHVLFTRGLSKASEHVLSFFSISCFISMGSLLAFELSGTSHPSYSFQIPLYFISFTDKRSVPPFKRWSHPMLITSTRLLKLVLALCVRTLWILIEESIASASWYPLLPTSSATTFRKNWI